MKTGMLLILFFYFGFQSAIASEAMARGKYTAGLSAYDTYKALSNKDYAAAVEYLLQAEILFKESFQAWQHPQTAYFIAIVNYELRDHEDITVFAQRAKLLHPPKINAKYLPSIDDLIDYPQRRQETLNRSKQRARAGVMLKSYIRPPEFIVPENSI